MTASRESSPPPLIPVTNDAPEVELLSRRYRRVRAFTEALCKPLVTEDYVVQTMENVSPTKWHLAHTSWFFETFILTPHADDYRSPNPRYVFLFNSYYNAVGDKHQRDNRGFITRPTVSEVYDYRSHVDAHMLALLERADERTREFLVPLVEIGLQHEQQHQELILTDIKHVLSKNPLHPVYQQREPSSAEPLPRQAWIGFEGGLKQMGHGGGGFAYDNESPRHQVFLNPFSLSSRLVSNGEYAKFIEDGGYERPELWLSDGWAVVQAHEWRAPLYWETQDGRWRQFTLSGMRDIDETEPTCHVSYYEADAYARWASRRLPTEAEWEVASEGLKIAGNFVENKRLHPAPAAASGGLEQMFGDAWEWTQSPYSPYPGYRAPEGALGEYNGKFMCNQFVLRGGACTTSATHIRRTYRNFFHPDSRWQFTGIRLAADGEE